MLHQCYIAGWERKRFSAFGRELYPLTLGHARFLYLAESPLVVPGTPPPQADDLMLFAAVCSLPTIQERQELSVVRDAARGMIGRVEDAAKEIGGYMAYYAKPIPRFSESSGESRVPWPWAYASILRRFYGYTPDAAWSELCAEAFWLGTAVAVQQGNTDFATLDEINSMILMEESA